MTARDYPWPALADGSVPEWNGFAFRLGRREVPMLSYSGGQSAWSDGLTKMHEESAGDDHPIDEASRGWTVAALKRYLHGPTPVLLEVGCSSGFLLQRLTAEFPSATVIGSDYLTQSLARAAERVPGVPLLQFDAVNCPLPDNSVDATILLNVLEHIDSDRKAIRQMARILRPGGFAIIEVPAGPHLFDLYDEHLQHYRRYSMGALRALADGAGLPVVEHSHIGCLVYPAFALVKRRNRRLLSAGPDLKRRVVEASIRQTRSSWVFRRLLQSEAWLGRHVSYPFGIRCVAVCRKGNRAV